MVVIALSNCPVSLRGDITLWLMELTANVYVGNVSARVRDHLWDRVCANVKNGTAILAYSTNNEQGFDYRLCNSSRQIMDFDGLKLMFTPVGNVITTYNSEGKEITASSAPKPGYSKAAGMRRAANAKKYGRITLPDAFAVLDLETTGFSPKTDRIIEIAVLKCKNSAQTDEFDCLVRFEGTLPKQITQLTGINDEMLAASGLNEKEAITKALDFIEGLPVIAHNAPFDMGFLSEAAKRQDIEFNIPHYHDTVKWAKQIVRGLTNYKLDTLQRHFGIPEVKNRHRAIDDCHLLYAVLERMFFADNQEEDK
jgi:CRISPR-associated protein Cas2